jgi:hypothetical protein
MAQTPNKTAPTAVDPAAFIACIEPPARRAEGERLLTLFAEVTGLEPRLWGPSMVGYGRYHYRYESGREGESFLTGFSPRKAALSIYVLPGYQFPTMQGLLERLGPHTTGAACLYIKRLSAIDEGVLREIVAEGVARMRATHQTWDA